MALPRRRPGQLRRRPDGGRQIQFRRISDESIDTSSRGRGGGAMHGRRRLDITTDELESDSYDLVHSRLLLMHMDDPRAVLRRMISALRPGGWLLAEEPDNGVVEAVDDAHPLAESFNAGLRKRVQYVTDGGIMDLRMGKSLAGLMASVDLTDVGNEGVARVVCGGEPMSLMWIKTWERVNDRLLADGVLSETEIVERDMPTRTPRSPIANSSCRLSGVVVEYDEPRASTRCRSSSARQLVTEPLTVATDDTRASALTLRGELCVRVKGDAPRTATEMAALDEEALWLAARSGRRPLPSAE